MVFTVDCIRDIILLGVQNVLDAVVDDSFRFIPLLLMRVLTTLFDGTSFVDERLRTVF